MRYVPHPVAELLILAVYLIFVFQPRFIAHRFALPPKRLLARTTGVTTCFWALAATWYAFRFESQTASMEMFLVNLSAFVRGLIICLSVPLLLLPRDKPEENERGMEIK